MKTRSFILTAFLASAALPLAPVHALPATPEPAARGNDVDALFAEWNRPDSPGCTVGISRSGVLVLAKGYGSANLEHAVPNGPDTVFPIGSMSKQFTATLVALLALDGKIDLDADVRHYLPELPAYPTPITARELVHHTGGLRDYQALRFLAGVPPEHIDAHQVLGLLLRQRAPQAPAGTRFDYDNSGYVMLRFLLERVSGKTLPALAQERIFGPLGMSHTRWLEDHSTVVPHRSTHYEGDRTTGYRATYGSPVMGSGGILTTVGDFARWQANNYNNQLGGGATLLAELLSPGTLPGGGKLVVEQPWGRSEGYGFGQFLDTWHGHRVWWHAGADGSDAERFPDDHLEVSVFCNGVIDSHLLAHRVAALYLAAQAPAGAPAKPAPAAAANPPVRPLPAATLSALVGRYRNPATGTVWSLVRDVDALVLDLMRVHLPLASIGEDSLLSTSAVWPMRVTFEHPQNGAVPRLHLFEDGEETAHYDRLPPSPSAMALAAYTGRFRSEEVGATYELAVEDGSLRVRTPVQPNGPLLFLADNVFTLRSDWFNVRFDFTRGPGAKVDGFVVDAGPASGIRFTRVEGCAADAR